MKYLFIVVLMACASCSLFNGFRKREFNDGTQNSFQILVPKGWSSVAITPDSNGKMQQVYTYKNGATFYISNTAKPINSNELIDTNQHIALQHPGGGTVYKGVMPGLLYWREIQKDAFRFGYKNVPTDLESRFDSALNYSALTKGVK